MESHISPVRAFRNLIVVVIALGAAGLAFIAALFPGIPTGVTRFLFLVVINSGITMAFVWTGIAVSISIRRRFQEAQ